MALKYAVTGDYIRITYSRHHTLSAATEAAKKLYRKWLREDIPGTPCGSGGRPKVIDESTGKCVFDPLIDSSS
jgi:hypothetical protein